MSSRPFSQLRMSRSSPCLRCPRASSGDWQAESSCLSSQEESETSLRTPEPVPRFESGRGLLATSESSQKTARQNDHRDSACSSDASTCRERTSGAFLQRQNLLQQRRLQKQRAQQQQQQQEPEPAVWLGAPVRSARSVNQAGANTQLSARRWSLSQPRNVLSKAPVDRQRGRGLPREREREMRQFQPQRGTMTQRGRSATAVSHRPQIPQRAMASNMAGKGSVSPSSRLDALVQKSDELLSLGQRAAACGQFLDEMRGEVLKSELQHGPSREENSHSSEYGQASARSAASKTLRDLFCLSNAVSQRSGEISSQLAAMLMSDSLTDAPDSEQSSTTTMQELSVENMELRETLTQAQNLMKALKQQCKDDQLSLEVMEKRQQELLLRLPPRPAADLSDDAAWLKQQCRDDLMHFEVMEDRQQDMLVRLSAECASVQPAHAAGCGQHDLLSASSADSIACQIDLEADSRTLPPLLVARKQAEGQSAKMQEAENDGEEKSKEILDPESAHLRAVASGASAVRELLEATEQSLIKTFSFHPRVSED